MTKKKETKEESELTVESLKAKYEEKLKETESYLAQALDLNKNLIQELENHEKQISAFSEVRAGLEQTIDMQQNEINNLTGTIEEYHQRLLQERIEDLATRWMDKYNLSPSKKNDVMQMFSKFTTDEDFEKVETVLGIPKNSKPKPAPIPVTQDSHQLNSQKNNKPTSIDDLSRDDKINYYYDQFAKLSQGTKQ